MAHTKNGLDYFPFDVDFHNDPKIEILTAKHGLKAENIAIRLLCKIYREGYYLKWTEEDSLILAKKLGEDVTFEFVNLVISELCERNFFHKQLFLEHQILTSRGIQKRFDEAIKRRKNTKMLHDWRLNEHNVYIIDGSTNIMYTSCIQNDVSNEHSAYILRQSKVKESKVKESSLNNEGISNLNSIVNEEKITNPTPQKKSLYVPTIEEVKKFAIESNIEEKTYLNFFHYYNGQDWKTGGGGGGRKISDWHSKLIQWNMEEQRKQLDKEEKQKNGTFGNSGNKNNERYSSNEEDLKRTYQELQNNKCS